MIALTLRKPTVRLTYGMLLLFYVSGFIGLHSSYQSWFMSLTPLNLLVSTALVLWHQKTWNRGLVIAVMVSSFVGFTIEVIGVKTTLIFGEYWYGQTLGWKIFEVPLMIAVNWTLLCLCSASILAYTSWHWIAKSALAAALMVGLDWFIEPVAITLDFWDWSGGHIPLRNYIGWYVTAFAIQIVYHRLDFDKKNKVAVFLFFLQLLFFASFKLFS